MSNHLPLAMLGAALFMAAGATAAADIAHGEQLHESHCKACHTRLTGGDPDSLYTRPDRKVHDRNGLWMQVQRCDQNLALKLFDDDLDSLAAYLNDTFYRFPETPPENP